MRTHVHVCLVLILLVSGRVSAIKEESEPADTMVGDTAWGDVCETDLKRGHEREGTRRAAANNKVETLYNIPPERVQDWIDGKLSEVELQNIVASTRAMVAPVPVASSPEVWVKRPLLLGSGALLLTCCYVVYSRRGQKTRAKTDTLSRTNRNRSNNMWDIEG